MKRTYCTFSGFVLVLLTAAAICIPFLNKAYHIDDPFVLTIAGNILKNPADPFAGEFDWTGELTPIFETTTNPPLISYYLAPFAYYFNFSEFALHAAMALFIVMIGWGTVVLSNRFACGYFWPLAFVMFSAAIMVSGNVMRDIPAAGLGVAGIGFFIMGCDKENRFYLFLGSVLTGLAVLTKYSSIILIPVLLLYPIFKRKLWLLGWVLPAVLLVLGWCLHNVAMYERVHILFLTLHRRTVEGIAWYDKALGAMVVLSSMMYLLPALLFAEWKRKRWIALSGCVPVGVIAFWAAQRFFQWNADYEYLFWCVTGALLLYLCLFEGIRFGIRWLGNSKNEYAADSLFLFAWLCAPVLFSILFVPFQAVRHQIPTLFPLAILAFRSIHRTQYMMRSSGLNTCLLLLIVVQAAVGYTVAVVDYQFAETYRSMAQYAKQQYSDSTGSVWFVGHWGWQYYATQAGFQQRHSGGALPRPGDIVLWPLRVHYENVWKDLGNDPFRVLDRRTVEQVSYNTPIRLRHMNFAGASFYAVIREHIPYRLFQNQDLETLKVFRVKEYDPTKVLR